MNKVKLAVLVIMVLLGFSSFAFAETIILKSGKTIEGKLIEKTDKYITIDFYNVHLTYFNDEIESIDGQKMVMTLDEKSKTEAEYYNGRGITYASRGEVEQAIPFFNKAIELYSECVDAYCNRCLAHYILKDFNKAISDCSKAIELNPKSAIAFYNRALTYHEIKEFEKATADYSKAIEFNPNDSASLANRGLVYGMLGYPDMAIADFTKAIEINPGLGAAYYNRALVYFYKKEYGKSWDDAHKAESLGLKFNPQMFKEIKKALDSEREAKQSPDYPGKHL